MEHLVIGTLGVILLLVLIAMGTEVGIALGITGIIGYGVIMSFNSSLSLLGTLPFGSLSVFSYATIPLFILMGSFILTAGISGNIYKVFQTWFGRFRGGVLMATIAANASFGACCGSTFAAAAIFSKISIPEMVKLGVNKSLAAASVAAAGTIAAIIPPSITIILYGIITGVPIGPTLMAGFLPGILSAINFMILIYFLVSKYPQFGGEARIPKISWAERIGSLKSTWAILLLIVIVLGGIFTGIVTPTEAGGLGAVGAFLIGVAMGKMTFAKFGSSLRDATAVTSQIFIIILGGLMFSRFIAVSGVGNVIVTWATSLDANRYVILFGILFFYIILGCFLDAPSIMVITLPIVFPIITSLGFNGIWFGILVTKVVEIGLITPPLGLNVYVVQSSSPIPIKMEEIFQGVGWFVIAELVTLVLLVVFPQISLLIPNLMVK